MSEDWTPGPWTGPHYHNDVGPNDDGFWEWYAVETANETIAKCDDRANARFIAAAPDLYAALEALCEASSDDEHDLWPAAYKALAKARGEVKTDTPRVQSSALSPKE